MGTAPQTTRLRAPDGTMLALRYAGDPAGTPLVLIHGWAQSADCWQAQLNDPALQHFQLLAPDLRGHGGSERPEAGYDSGAVLAEDLAAVLEFAGTTPHRRALLVGWSFGGIVITDYLRRYGTAALAGLLLTGAVTEMGRGRGGGQLGRSMLEALPDALSEEAEIAEPALRAFTAHQAGTPDPDRARALLATARATPARVRAGLFARTVDTAEVLSAAHLVSTVLHAEDDPVVDPASGRFAAAALNVSGACELITWAAGGHMAFAEYPAEFRTLLLALAKRAGIDADASARHDTASAADSPTSEEGR